jgi:hypothetical protein
MNAEGVEALRQAAGHAPQISQFHPAEQSVCDASLSSRQTPPRSEYFFAKRFATLASVLVGAMPTDTGILVHRCTVRRSSRAWASRRD